MRIKHNTRKSISGSLMNRRKLKRKCSAIFRSTFSNDLVCSQKIRKITSRAQKDQNSLEFMGRTIEDSLLATEHWMLDELRAKGLGDEAHFLFPRGIFTAHLFCGQRAKDSLLPRTHPLWGRELPSSVARPRSHTRTTDFTGSERTNPVKRPPHFYSSRALLHMSRSEKYAAKHEAPTQFAIICVFHVPLHCSPEA